MRIILNITLVLFAVALPTACRRADPSRGGTKSLAEARTEYSTPLAAKDQSGETIPIPPADLFQVVEYESAVGNLAAYLSPDPQDGKKHPAVIWITGGDCNTLGDVWSPRPRRNDQSAAAYRQAGLVLMFPSLRGGNQNPGFQENFYGEVDDILAAQKYLAQQPFVDPERIYLGGHSTGGTLVLLVAEMGAKFRAIFSFGPVGDVSGYGSEYLHAVSATDRTGLALRSPIWWLRSITSPTFVFEGVDGNIDQLRKMTASPPNPKIRFYEVKGASHFSILAPVNALLAQKMVADSGSETNIAVTGTELASLFAP